VVLHCNHADEFTPETRAACARLIDAGLPMRRRVLLKGVTRRGNDERLLHAVAARHQALLPGYHDLAAPAICTAPQGQAITRSARLLLVCKAATYQLDIPGRGSVGPISAPGRRRLTVSDPREQSMPSATPG
jgi:lysine 2,3-aminomutase